jgi:hypothetical protein
MPKLKATVICGYLSYIPLCCIIFYITLWLPILHILPVRFIISYQLIKDEVERRGTRLRFRSSYVMCPVCILLKRQRHILDCDPPPVRK